MSLVPVVVFVIFAVIVVLRALVVVPAGSAYVVERLGRYARMLPAGVHVVVPFFDVIRFRYSLAPQDEHLTDRCITLDNVPVTLTSAFRWQIADAQKASYGTASIGDYARGIVQHAQRQCIAARPWKDLRETTRELQQDVLRAVAEPAAAAGVKVFDHDVEQIDRVAPAP
jgi:regulator of protease activity HflC (stomatin/prohibitin superfamily)